MSSAELNPLDWHRRFAVMELCIAKIESRLDSVDRIVKPEGLIGEAFQALETHIDQRLDTIDAKLDTIMRHITGINRDS
jgi:tetrahydromethanopterin S-methyltransferase subunit G